MSDPIATIQSVAAQADADLAAVQSAADLEQFRIKYLGSKGQFKELMKLLGTVPANQKRELGQQLNASSKRITEAFEAAKSSLGSTPTGPIVDVTEPGRKYEIGHLHILMQVIDELTELFGRMGFAVASGPEVEDDFHNFVALNIPESHPARDPLDNFYLEPLAGLSPSSSPKLLRTQTSTVQIRVMETQKPPIRVVIPGRVYRPDTVDQTHLFMFHQLEALVVDRDVTMIDLKSTIIQFIKAYFGPDTQVRFRPSFFPFTEPSGEVDVWFEDKQRWIELGGCGMVHPNVLTACHIDPEEFSGWAFGFGIERIAMRKYGIDDIRYFVENDLRFLRQF
ncbi:MAG: phenylalanine--tRNA ligase subunit alpha [Phycisphaerae bacterium]|nr:phenylalanine--tRNA ligase subunit alpha [Phycisphaerae bacterium]